MIDINLNIPIDTTPTDGSTNLIDSNAVFDGLALKVDKVTGKQLSTEDYTTTEKSKLAGIASGAEVNVNADFNAVSGDAQILNKPTFATYISDAITDGEITKAPTQNAVFDALALKENNLPSIVGNSLKVLRVNAGETAKEWATISTGLTIGTTPITSGTVGRVLFEGAGNVVQEDAGLTFNNGAFAVKTGASTRLSIGNDPVYKVFNLCDSVYNDGFSTYLKTPAGATPQVTCSGNGLVLTSSFVTSLSASNQIQITTNSIVRSYFDNAGFVGIGPKVSGLGARLDVQAQGALSTDIAFRVRNSADTVSLFEGYGNGDVLYRNNANTSYLYWQSGIGLEVKNGSSEFLFFNNSGSVGLRGTSGLRLRTNNTGIYINDSGNFYFGGATGISLGTGANVIILKNATIPTSNIADAGQIYVENGALKYRGSSGTITVLGVA